MDDRSQTIEQIKLLRELQRRKARKTLRDFLSQAAVIGCPQPH